MSKEILRPNGSLSITGTGYTNPTLVGGADADDILSDDTDTSYVSLTGGEGFYVTFGDYSIPAGAVGAGIALRIRSKVPLGGARASVGVASQIRNDSTVEKSVSLIINWATTATTYLYPYTDGPVFDPDNIRMVLGIPEELSYEFRVYRAYADVFYVLKPELTITQPTGTISDSQVTVDWVPDLDSTGGEQFAYQVAIMANGEHPDTDTPILSSGAFSTATSVTFEDALPDADYEVYVKIAQLVNGEAHWSDWETNGFTVDASPPGTPTITLTPQASRAQVKVALHDTAGDSATNGYDLQRQVDGEWIDVRSTTNGLTGNTDFIVYDHEPPNGETLSYRTRAISATGIASPWTTGTTSWSSSEWWLKHPFDPSLDVTLNMRSYPGQSSNVRVALHWVLGRSDPVAISDVTGLPSGDLQVRCDTYDERQALSALVDAGVPLLLQGPVDERDDDRWIVFTGAARERIIDKAWAPETWETLPWQEVARPDGDLTEWPPDSP